MEPEDLLDAARAYARDIARNCSPRAMAVVRHQVYGDLDRTFTDALARSYSAMEFFAGSPDFREGVSSFVEKREPKFEGLPAGLRPGRGHARRVSAVLICRTDSRSTRG